MKQEEKTLLLRDLCGRLPYGVKLRHESFARTYTLYAVDSEHLAVNLSPDGLTFDDSWWNSIEQVKPYLFPLSSMTEEQSKEFALLQTNTHTSGFLFASDCSNMIRWLNENHFDYIGLIPKGLAIDATGLNIY